MLRLFTITFILFSIIISFASCEGCTKKITKKATTVTLSAVEGVAEAVGEHGEKVGEKISDATGKIAEGVGRSIDRQLNEHAAKVASVTGRTLVQVMDGVLDGGELEYRKAYYNDIIYTSNICDGVKLEYVGLMKSGSVVDLYLKITTSGKYQCKMNVYNENDELLLTKQAQSETNERNKVVLVSFGLDEAELSIVNNTDNRIEVSTTPDK